uniref:Uncharacterized protein n=1 Tax=Myotis myotis TaxID=51298 RepID=A0A7J7ZXW5_MYOMY|nr:hypothetical protein mMyoMyo1_009976 [Myotis myotis]
MTHTDHQGADAQCRSCSWWSVHSHSGSSAQPQARLMADSTAVVVGASPASSAALRMSDCSLGLLPAGKWTFPEGCRAARGMSDCQLGPDPPGSRPKPAGGHPPRGPRLQEGKAPAEGQFLCTGPLVVNNAAMNIEVHIFSQISVFCFFGYIPGSVIAGS